MEDLAMKKLGALISVIVFCVSGIAKEPGISWVSTSEGKMNCKKIHIGYYTARVVLENGQKKTIPIDLISSYTLNGKEFTRLPLYKDGKPTGERVFMELVTACYNLNLYKYEYTNTNMYGNAVLYFLYEGDKLHLALDEKSLPNIWDHFGLSMQYK
jgi:hypothetical protein